MSSLSALQGVRRGATGIPGVLLALLFSAPGFAAAQVDPDQASATALVGTWAGAVEAQGRRFPIVIELASGAAAAVALVDYPDVPVYAARFQARQVKGGLELTRRPPDAPASLLRLRVESDHMHGTFTGAGVEDARIELARRSATPGVLRETEVEFDNGDLRLAGTVVWPDGDGPFPGIVVSHGSGPGHRGQALYRTEAFRYARLGVVALVYDKRGNGDSQGDYATASLHDLAGDALAGVRLLRKDPKVRKDAVGVAGHSQGGWIAPLAATLSTDVAFVVATAASALGPMDQSLYHNANEMRAAGFAQADIARAQALRSRLYARVKTGAFDAEFEHDLGAASNEPWFAASQLPTPPMDDISAGERALLLFEPLPVWRNVRVPVLAIWGSDDINLPAERSRDLVARELTIGGNPSVSLHLIPGLTHGFLRSTRPGDAWDFPRGSPEVELFIADWMRRQFGERDRLPVQ